MINIESLISILNLNGKCNLLSVTYDVWGGGMKVTSCCKKGPIISENYCPNCGKKIIYKQS